MLVDKTASLPLYLSCYKILIGGKITMAFHVQVFARPPFYGSQVKSNEPKSTSPLITDFKGTASENKW